MRASVPYLRSSRRPPRGAVLIFAIVLLVLLLGLGVMFVLYVRREFEATGNALRATQSTFAAESGLAQARGILRAAVGAYLALSPDGAFDALISGANAYLQVDGGLRSLEVSPDGRYAWLYTNSNKDYCGNASLAETNALVFTETPLAHLACPNGQLRRDRLGGAEHIGKARRFTLVGKYSCFYVPQPGVKARTALKSDAPLAEYYIWVADLDGKLHALPCAWGLNTTSLADQTNDIVAKEILQALSDYGKSDKAAEWAAAAGGASVGDGLSYDGMKLETVFNSKTRIEWLWSQTAPYGSLSEMALYLGITPPATGDWNYLHARYGLEGHFNLYKDVILSDVEMANLNAPAPYVKETETALNVNTASLETLAASLVRVPVGAIADATNAAPIVATCPKHGLNTGDKIVIAGVQGNTAANNTLNPTWTANVLSEDTFELIGSTGNGVYVAGTGVFYHPAKMCFLAKRICAKRPFLCRMDFEDFLAAHLNSDAADLIAAAIPKRVMPTLADYLDIQGLPDNFPHPAKEMLDPLKQQSRFAWFRTGVETKHLLRGETFCNLLNSISGKNRSGAYGYSYYSYDNVKSPVAQPGADPPKFEYDTLNKEDIEAGQKTFDANKLQHWRATRHKDYGGYYEMVFDPVANRDTQEIAVDNTDLDPDKEHIVVRAGSDNVLQTPVMAPDTEGEDAGEKVIFAGKDPDGQKRAHTRVHGPLRAYRLQSWSDDRDPQDQKPSLPPNKFFGDAAWSPRFCFRSRFFAIYVLARTLKPNGEPVRGSERRLEAIYDALRDEVLSRRWTASERRNIGTPQP